MWHFLDYTQKVSCENDTDVLNLNFHDIHNYITFFNF